jgi:hypothetical protein
VQGAYITYSFTNGVKYANLNNMIWNIAFNLPKLPASGNLTLNTAWAGQGGAAIQVFVNNTNATGTPFRDFYPNTQGSGDSLIRQGIHDKYGVDHTSIPVSKFITGTNYITLVQRRAASALANYAMYDYLDLELPTAAAPPNLTALAGDGKVILSWANSPGASGYNLRQSTTNGGPYKIVGSNVSALTLTNSGLTNGVLYYFTIAATNSFGESVPSAQVSARPTSGVATNINFVMSNGYISLNWPADHTGWILQTQTNSLNVGLGTNWTSISGSDSTNQIVFQPDPAAGSVFFRLAHP